MQNIESPVKFVSKINTFAIDFTATDVQAADYLLGEKPFSGMFTGYFFNPCYRAKMGIKNLYVIEKRGRFIGKKIQTN
jgi:hypothetical protein